MKRFFIIVSFMIIQAAPLFASAAADAKESVELPHAQNPSVVKSLTQTATAQATLLLKPLPQQCITGYIQRFPGPCVPSCQLIHVRHTVYPLGTQVPSGYHSWKHNGHLHIEKDSHNK